jgi:hypothetical protein
MDNIENLTILEADFSGRGSSSFKYHMAKWDSLAMPREFGA